MRSILLVDDDIGALASVELVLDRAGYTVATAESGEKALEWLETNSPDLIVLDVVMPGLSGLDVCRRIRSDPDEYRSLTPIIMLTTKNSVRAIVEGDAAGSDLYLMKPILGTRLLKGRRPSPLRRHQASSGRRQPLRAADPALNRPGSHDLKLTLFVRPDDEPSAKAREELQVVMSRMPASVSVEVCEVGDPQAARMGLSMAPILRMQVGGHTPEWVVRIDRRSLARRLLDFGIPLRD